MSDVVTLTVNGMDFSGWKSVRIEAGIERQARSFEMSVTDRWPGSSGLARRINPGDLCEVRIGADLVCTGHADATPINYDANGYTIMVRGRSKTADLVDCSADNAAGQWKDSKSEKVISDLAGRYGLTVSNETDTGAALIEHQIQQGETAHESLDRLARQRQILITDDAAGNVVIAAPGSGGRASSALELGVNILTASAGFDYSEVYSNYEVKGQRKGTDDAFGADAAQTRGTATDTSLKRRRVLIVRQHGQADPATCAARATYEQQIRAAKAQEIRYTVAGWRQADGSLWRPNLTVRVVDALMGVNADLLITECNYRLDDDAGQITELVVMPAAGLMTGPETAKASKSGGWGG